MIVLPHLAQSARRRDDNEFRELAVQDLLIEILNDASGKSILIGLASIRIAGGALMTIARSTVCVHGRRRQGLKLEARIISDVAKQF